MIIQTQNMVIRFFNYPQQDAIACFKADRLTQTEVSVKSLTNKVVRKTILNRLDNIPTGIKSPIHAPK